jgi:hypothetical protein
MAMENYGPAGKFDPELAEMPQVGWQTVTFWASRFGLSRETFVKKLKNVGLRPNSFDLVEAATLFRAIERHDHDRDQRDG